MACRHCHASLDAQVIDLGPQPPSNGYIAAEMLGRREYVAPLRVMVCQACWLVQTEDHLDRNQIFDDDYAYFSGYSKSWLQHCERFASDMVARLGLDGTSLVIEVAANDGYLLQFFSRRGVPCLGIEPTASTAREARAKGLRVFQEFFGEELGKRLATDGMSADLVVANNVLAHVPDINDFVAGFKEVLAPSGVATFEFPHVVRLIDEGQFDTIYHEHFSYLSLGTVDEIFASQGLSIFEVERLRTHGGSLRVYAQRSDTGQRPVLAGKMEVLEEESAKHVRSLGYYSRLQRRADAARGALRRWLTEARADDKLIVGYGAAAKGNTLLNYADVSTAEVEFVADANPFKQGKYLPGTGIPIVDPGTLRRRRPDFVLVLPWNLYDEISSELSDIDRWGGRFVRVIPRLSISDADRHDDQD